jgi:hypothetical protein
LPALNPSIFPAAESNLNGVFHGSNSFRQQNANGVPCACFA